MKRRSFMAKAATLLPFGLGGKEETPRSICSLDKVRFQSLRDHPEDVDRLIRNLENPGKFPKKLTRKQRDWIMSFVILNTPHFDREVPGLYMMSLKGRMAALNHALNGLVEGLDGEGQEPEMCKGDVLVVALQREDARLLEKKIDHLKGSRSEELGFERIEVQLQRAWGSCIAVGWRSRA